MNQEKKKEPNPRIRHSQTCQFCEARFPITLAKCTSCGMWNTPKITKDDDDQTVLLSKVEQLKYNRIETGAWDKCFSYDPTTKEKGIVDTSVTLLGGEPGAGKSTLSLQLADEIAEATKREILYVGAEESAEEIKMRALRLEVRNMHLFRVYPIGANAELGPIILSRRPSGIVVDSLPGLITDLAQGTEFCKRFKPYAVELRCPVIIVDQVNKAGDFAGFMSLQHAVDTLISIFRGDGESREMESHKNRYGPLFQLKLLMTHKGLIEHKNK